MKRWLAVLVPCLAFTTPVAAQPGAIRIDQTAEYARAQHHPALAPPPAGFTVECWFKYDPSLPVSPAGHMVRKETSPNVSYFLRVRTNLDLEAEYVSNGSLRNLRSAGGVQPLTWQHAAVTFDGQTGRLYLNFQLVDTDFFPGLPAAASGVLTIGGGQNGTDEKFGGDIDEIRIWGRPLSAMELQSNANRAINPAPDLRAVWHFDNGSFTDAIAGIVAVPHGGVGIVPSTSPAVGDFLMAPALGALGSTVGYELNSSVPGAPYVMEVSFEGCTQTAPSSPFGGACVLNPPYLFTTFAGIAPPGTFTGFIGFFDGAGRAFPSIQIPDFMGLVGLTLTAQHVRLDPSSPLNIGALSVPRATLITEPPPAVASIAPSTSPLFGNWPVVITGQHFQIGATVRFGGIPALNVQVTPPSLITCMTPPGAALGPVSLAIANPDGQSLTVPQALTYVPNLVLQSVSPLSAPGGAAVTISGAGIQPGATVHVAGSTVTVTGVQAGQITFLAPPNPPCNAAATVMNPDGQIANITWNPSPAVTGLVPGGGPAAGGGLAWILGGPFSAGTSVTIGGAPAAIQSLSPTAMVIQVPAGTAGPALVEVTGPTGCAAIAAYQYH